MTTEAEIKALLAVEHAARIACPLINRHHSLSALNGFKAKRHLTNALAVLDQVRQDASQEPRP